MQVGKKLHAKHMSHLEAGVDAFLGAGPPWSAVACARCCARLAMERQ